VTRFIVVRHGETQWNVDSRIQGHTDSELTATGERQAGALARRLEREAFDALVSSDLGRALTTARIIAKRTHHEPVVEDARFRERCFGAGEGLTYGELDHEYPEVFSKVRETDPDYCIPGGESRRQFYDRVQAAFESLAAERRGQRVLVVAHGGVLASLYRVIHKLGIVTPYNIPIINASYNAVAFDGAAWTVETWGDTGHLGEAALFEAL
jgi:2,3-bisphosphoglycerate-dependent phosphoglycerate mutase